MVEHASDQSTGESHDSIPLKPVQSNYLLVKFWNRALWKAIKGSGPNSPGLSRFFEDQSGHELSLDAKTQVSEDIHGFWLDTFRAQDPEKQLGNWGDIGLKLKDDFRDTMEKKHPWLRLCDGRWKSKQLWVNYYSNWKPPLLAKTTNAKRNATLTPNPEDSTPIPDDPIPGTPIQIDPVSDTPIEISSNTKGTSAGSKRRHEDEANPVLSPSSKRSKGKEPLVAPTEFHHSKPVPRKTRNARKVSDNQCQIYFKG